MYVGIGVSPGIAINKVMLLKEQEFKINKDNIDEKLLTSELNKYKDAVEKAKQQLLQIKKKVLHQMSKEQAEIFDAHLMILEDPTLLEKVEDKINEDQISADNATEQVIRELVQTFENMQDQYLQERVADIKDVGERIIKNILDISMQTLTDLQEDIVLVAADLTPSQTAEMDKERIKGFVTDRGGRTSHTAIMARSLEIPAVVGLKDVTQRVKNGDEIIVDGTGGLVEINPAPETLQTYQDKKIRYLQEQLDFNIMKQLPGETIDGYRVELAANIGTLEDVEGALHKGADGIGLFRTEFLFMNRTALPTEEEQFAAYKSVVQKMQGKPVIIRTLDIGGDKSLPYLDLPPEPNPFLGVRAIRLCLQEKELFKVQLKAILRASDYGKIKIMYPMIATVEEVREANRILAEVKKESAGKFPYDEKIEVGIMVEIPSAAINADLFVEEVDFFSIGTNDLVQYTMAVDRMNQNLSKLYDPYNPAILRLVKKVIAESHRAGKWTGICGEMAGEPQAALILLGLGINELSMSAVALPKVKKIIRSITWAEARKIAGQALEMKSSAEIIAFVDEELSKRM